MVEQGATVTYTQLALKIRTVEGLSAGNIIIAWRPATDAVTVNKLQILRGSSQIDVLSSGQTFTTLRREANLEAATLDGQLTATIQAEGLQIGDTIVLATTVERRDPVLKDHVQFLFGTWEGAPIRSARARVIWPADLDLNFRFAGGLEAAHPRRQGSTKSLEISLEDVEPRQVPKNAPNRFQLGRMAEASNLRSWAQVAELMRPLFDRAAVIPAAGPLREEVEKIKRSSPDPLVRARQALELVQNRIRYVALLMGEGSYVPANAQATWSRRFGDCKAKTALLIGVLHELGIEAAPVAVHSSLGDALPERLPAVATFDHVLVRARIGGKDYWLDGTRRGDGRLEDIAVPAFRWGLPLVRNAALVPLNPPPLDQPNADHSVEIDASRGVKAPAPTKATVLLRGDLARATNTVMTSVAAGQRDQILHEYWKENYDFVTVKTTSFEFEKEKAELRLSMSGEAKLDWSGGYFNVPFSTVGYEPDFERAPGPLREAPFVIAHPDFWNVTTTIHLPKGLLRGQTRQLPPIDEKVGGMEYHRLVKLDGDTMTVRVSGRSLAHELPYAQAIAAEPRLRSLSDEDIALRLPRTYQPTASDLKSIAAEEPGSARAFIDRGNVFLDSGKYDEAIADFTKAAELDPSSRWALANRGISYVWKQQFAAAERDLLAAEALDPENSVVLRARGLMAELKGDFAGAVVDYSRSLEVEPGDGFALMHRAAAYWRLNEDSKALADTDAALRIGRKSPNLRLIRANIFFAQGHKEQAAREAELVIRENPDDGMAHVTAARIYARIPMRLEAERAFERALAIEPEAYVYVNRAQSRPLSDHEGRLRDIELALKLDPDFPEALAAKAEQLTVMGKLAAALPLYDSAIAVAPESTPLALGRAVLLHKMGRTAEAEKIFAQNRERASTASQLNSLCWKMASAGILLEDALRNCEDALKLSPEHGPTIDSLGMVLLRLGRLDEALATYGKAVAKRLGAPSLMGRAMVYARMGRDELAAADRSQALKLDPDVENRFAEYGLKL
jgi:tetratricopeptide (TPR) repeat protein